VTRAAGRRHRDRRTFPVRRQASIRYGVHTTALGRRAFGKSTRLAGFSVSRSRRTAAFSATRSMARIRDRTATLPVSGPHPLVPSHSPSRCACSCLARTRRYRSRRRAADR
jgi:hypothetical protein